MTNNINNCESVYVSQLGKVYISQEGQIIRSASRGNKIIDTVFTKDELIIICQLSSKSEEILDFIWASGYKTLGDYLMIAPPFTSIYLNDRTGYRSIIKRAVKRIKAFIKISEKVRKSKRLKQQMPDLEGNRATSEDIINGSQNEELINMLKIYMNDLIAFLGES